MTKETYDCEFQALICEKEGYEAENQYRFSNASTIVYGAEHFLDLADKFRNLAKEFSD